MKITSNFPLTECPDCARVHIGRCGGLSFAARLSTTYVHPDATPTREKHNYWDQQALDDQFGEDATERSLELSEGRGFNGPTNPQDVAKLFD